MLFDTHCHLNDEQFEDDVDEVVKRAKSTGVERFVVPGVDVSTSRRAIALTEQYDEVFAAVGIHPESLPTGTDESNQFRVMDGWYSEIEGLLSHPKVVAIGEVGLDYHWDIAPHDVQQKALRKQIAIAGKYHLPVIIHNRDATLDTVRILEEECRGRVTGVMHCFTGDIEVAKRCIDLGFFISFGGSLTFKNARDVRDTAAQIPLSWLLLETDSPYLSPHPFRGKRNEPSRIRLAAETLADLKNVTVPELEKVTASNARRLFTKVR